MLPVNLLALASAAYSASGMSDPFGVPVDQIWIDINASAMRGATKSITFYYDRLGSDGIWYRVWSGTALTAVGAQSQSIGQGLETAKHPGMTGRLGWTVAGTAVATTVGTGANSATQNLADTSSLQVGDVLHFATANVNRTILTIPDGTHVTLSSAVNSTDSEAVTVVGTPVYTFSASVQGK